MIADSVYRTVLLVDFGLMTASLVAFIVWRFCTQRAALNVPLLYSILAMLFRALMPFLLLYNFSSLLRDDGFTIVWVQWVLYCFAFNFGGLTHALVFLGQHPR